ncbi:decarboxylase [Lentzea aerocolonigenes]|uniref:decarboxylase n=1 Tax=Lentzea aerocolonigenes TaxID=68170 RepID=UPI0004C43E42|nr:decarboxylase [Lentzea aerocolonigenes]MCP2243435.1 diaminopimelate decarboxylase [Lentzea aerocolonigenes]
MSLPKMLAQRHGSPLYVYDLDRVLAARRDLSDALPPGCDVYYALKANPHPDLARELRLGGCKAEISSLGELASALTAGFDAGDVLYTGPGKTPSELDSAFALGVRRFSAESPTDLQHIGAAALRCGTVASCLLRINSETSAANTGIRMTGRPSQFGIDSETIAGLAAELRAVPGTTIEGLHLFSQSNAESEDALIGELSHAVELAAHLEKELDVTLGLLDIGGGFAAPYGRHGSRCLYPRLRPALESVLDEWFPRWCEGTPRLAVEAGRYLVGDSGTLVTTVSNMKTSRGKTFVVLDAGINTFGGMSGLGRTLPVSVEIDGDGPRKAFLAGPLCTPGDILGREVPIPDLRPGDLVEIPNAGAYGVTASPLMFLGRPAPTEVVVRGGEVVSVSRIEHVRRCAG